MAHLPSRPFESLEWYREAARNNFRDDDPRKSLARWANGLGMLHAHASLFAVGIVVLLGINLIRTPDSIWASRWIMAWTVLLLLHAVIIGFLWAMRQWNSDTPDEALQMTSAREWERQATFSWGQNGTEAQDVDFRVTTSTRPASPSSDPEPASDPGWAGWNSADQDDDVPAAERASWKEASAAAWLDRPRPAKAANGDREAKPDA
ncbi:MAG: hypothetical protein WKF63_04430 [Thermomicrobiales bacterium]